jgi:hypothetical protein
MALVSADSDFEFTADPKILEKLLSKIDGEDVTISFNDTDLTVKVFTRKGSKESFTTLQSFPTNKMLTFEDKPETLGEVGPANREAMLYALNFAENYLAPAKEDQRMFDFVIINGGVAYAANGSNKIGFLVSKSLEGITNLRVRKTVVSTLKAVLSSYDDKQVWWNSNDREYFFFNESGSVFFSYLKAVADPPPMPNKYLKAEGPYLKLKKQDLVRVLERIIVSMSQAQGSGIELTVGGKGAQAYLDVGLITSLKSRERIECERVDESDGEVKHVVEYKQFKTMLDSLSGEDAIHLYVNDDSRSFKIYDKGMLGDNKYITVSVGGYSKVVGS